MTSIITADIINSRKSKTVKNWLIPLKTELNRHGKTPKAWEIFRGDSFQLEIKKPVDALIAAIKIKAVIKSIKDLDIRISIGIGAKSYSASKITQSNGEAFIYSGEAFEKLRNLKQTIIIKSPWPDFDYTLNTMLSLASITMDNWSVTSSSFMVTAITHKNLLQTELGKKMKISQSSVSERQKRAKYEEIMSVDEFYRTKITQLIK